MFHLAAQVTIRGSFDRFREDLDTNVMGTARLLSRARSRVRSNGSRSRRRWRSTRMRDSPTPIDESHPTRPLSPYGVGKLAAEDVSAQVLAGRGIPFTAVRYFNTYGPGQGYTPYVGVLTIFITRLLRGRTDHDLRRRRAAARLRARQRHRRRHDGHARTARRALQPRHRARARRSISSASMVLARLAPDQQPLYAAAPGGELRYSVANIDAARRHLGYAPARSLARDLDDVIQAVRVREGVK